MDRKEAIEIVQKNYPHVGFSGSEFETALRELVPEFKEQPDPRHSLIEFIKWSCDRGSITPEQRKNVDFWLAYLERQKEQKHVILGPDETEFPYNHPANTLEGEIKNIWSKLSIENAFVASFEGFREVILHFVNFIQKEQKPAEWSEEDEKILKDCIDMPYSADFISSERKKDAIRWLKSLRPQLKREDWTDEDSLAIKEIQNALHIYMINRGISEKQRKKLARWLDIHCNAYPLPPQLYPHWKPSEEQINALQAFVGMIHPDARYDAVFSLLDELKAL